MNTVEVHGDTAKITMGRHTTTIDLADLDSVRQYSWNAYKTSKAYYISAMIPKDGGGKKCLYLHRLIMNAQPGQIVDHVNHDTMDNRRSNLRLCSPQQNGANKLKQPNCSSQFKGVSLCRQKWDASIIVNRKKIFIGTFTDEIDAAKAYDARARKEFGTFACLNFA